MTKISRAAPESTLEQLERERAIAVAAMRAVWRCSSKFAARTYREALNALSLKLWECVQATHASAAILLTVRDTCLRMLHAVNSVRPTIEIPRRSGGFCWDAVLSQTPVRSCAQDGGSWEVAIPLVDADGEVFSVVLLEFRTGLPGWEPMTHLSHTQEEIRNRSIGIQYLSHVLASHSDQVSDVYPFHADRGWDRRPYIAALLRALQSAIDKQRVQCVLWEVDWECEQLNVIATTGYDRRFESELSLPLSSMVGEVAQQLTGSAQVIDDVSLCDAFVHKDVALAAGCKNASVVSFGDGQRSPHRYVLVFYGFQGCPAAAQRHEWGTPRLPAEDTMRSLAATFERIVSAHATQFVRLARLQVEEVLQTTPAMRRGDRMCELMARIFGASSASIDLRAANGEIASVGLSGRSLLGLAESALARDDRHPAPRHPFPAPPGGAAPDDGQRRVARCNFRGMSSCVETLRPRHELWGLLTVHGGDTLELCLSRHSSERPFSESEAQLLREILPMIAPLRWQFEPLLPQDRESDRPAVLHPHAEVSAPAARHAPTPAARCL